MSQKASLSAAFDRRRTHLVATGVYLLAVIAWVAILTRWVPMPAADSSMDGMAGPGVPEALAVSGGVGGWLLYLAMWGTMMVAMMYPSSVPLVRLYYATLDGTPRRTAFVRLGAFLGTYTLAWTATGIVPLLVTRFVSLQALATAQETLLLGSALLLLGGYQLSPYKYRCLSRCRSPLGFLMQFHGPGLRGAVRLALRHGAYCIGCCWALFVFVVVVGSMNLVWMALVAVVISLERTVSWGERLAAAVGVLALASGVVLVAAAAV